jgi:hypothetical protein
MPAMWEVLGKRIVVSIWYGKNKRPYLKKIKKKNKG